MKSSVFAVLAAIAIAVLSFALISEAGRADRAERHGAASAAQVRKLSREVLDLRAALAANAVQLAASNAKIDALAAQVQSLGATPVVANTSSTTAPKSNNDKAKGKQKCTVNAFGVCI